jgi:hypothetical protein
VTWLLAISLASMWACCAPRSVWYPVFVLIAAALATMLMGVPRPIWTSTLEPDDLVIGADYWPGEAIYVWVSGDPPLALSLPWSEELASEIQGALAEAREGGLPGVHLHYEGQNSYGVEFGEALDLPPADGKP